eukprot:12670380-Alexandrium_andersonii.AAC.1
MLLWATFQPKAAGGHGRAHAAAEHAAAKYDAPVCERSCAGLRADLSELTACYTGAPADREPGKHAGLANGNGMRLHCVLLRRCRQYRARTACETRMHV